jgi:hypothetical protein
MTCQECDCDEEMDKYVYDGGDPPVNPPEIRYTCLCCGYTVNEYGEEVW